MSEKIVEMGINVDNLYREEVYTDLESGAIKCYIPIKIDGTSDETRERKFMVMTNIMSPQGIIPISALLDEDVNTLEKAIIGFREGIDNRIEQMVEDAQRQAIEEQSRIVTPDEVQGGMKLIK